MRRKPLQVQKTKRKCNKSGKIKWRTQIDALMAMSNIHAYKMRSSTKPTEIRAYQCPDCGYWHNTHQPLREHKEGA